MNLTDLLPVLRWLHRKVWDFEAYLDRCLDVLENSP
jgi:hypothetical protein